MALRKEKPKRKPPKAPASRLFEIFAGCYVSVVTRSIQATEDATAMLQIKGYFLDADDEFVYIGESPIEVAAAVARKEIITVAVDSGDIPDTGDMQ